MTGREYFIFGSTFVMGMFAGFFVFVTIYAPEQAAKSTNDRTSDPTATVIEGRMYGGCDESGVCASFKLADDRTYTYLSAPDADIEKGRLPSELTEDVLKSVGTESFFSAAKEINPGSCTSYVDGIDYTYDITFKGETYTLDTCTTALANNEKLQTTFASTWQFMKNPTTTYPAILEKGLGGVLQDRFQNTMKDQ